LIALEADDPDVLRVSTNAHPRRLGSPPVHFSGFENALFFVKRMNR
jgi:hypothetical protein